MTPSEIVGVVVAVLGLLAGLATWAFKVNSRHGVLAAKQAQQERMSQERHIEIDRRIAVLEQSNITTQANICKISEGVAVLLERTKNMDQKK